MIIHATQSISFANNSPPPQELLKMNKSNKNKRPRSVRQNVVKLRQRPEWSKARNAICIIWGLDLILVFCSCLGTFFHPRDILRHLSVPRCLPNIARGRISSGVVWVASEVRMIKIVHNASCSMWGLVISFWSFALAMAFIKTILVSICPLAVAWGLCQNQRGRTSSDVWLLASEACLLFPGWGFFHPYSIFCLIHALFCLLLGNTIWQTSVQLLFAQN